MAHLLSKGKEQVVAALEQATAAMNVQDDNKQARQQPKAQTSQGTLMQAATTMVTRIA